MGSRPTPPHAARLRLAQGHPLYEPGCYKCQMGDPHQTHQTPEEFYDITPR